MLCTLIYTDLVIVTQNSYIPCLQEEDNVKVYAVFWKCRFYTARSLYRK